MGFLKNKYYKVFPLSIFITKCTEEKVTFAKTDEIEIYQGKVTLSKGELKFEDPELLCFNGEGFNISKNIKYDNLLGIDNYFTYWGGFGMGGYKKYYLATLQDSLKNYSYGFFSEKDENGDLVKDGTNFISNHKYKFYFYKKLNFTKLNFILNGVDFKFTFKEEFNERDLYLTVKNYRKGKGTINFCSNYNENYILKKINNGVLAKNNNESNKGIYIKFLDCLINGKNLKIDLGCKINIKDVLLSKDLEKIYKIKGDKKNEIINLLNGEYEDKKYLSLQKKLKGNDNFKNITIENGDIDKDIENLDDITITITADPENKIIVPKQCTIKFEAGDGLYITDNTGYLAKKSITFSDSEGGITTETNIEKYINTKYDKIKDKYAIMQTGDDSVNFKDETVVTVTIHDVIPGITSKQDYNKVYVNVQFKVLDNTKYKLKGDILKLNNNKFELEKNSKYENLIKKVKAKLGGISFKNGFTVLYNNINFTTGSNLTNDGIYTFILVDDDPNFVEEIKKEQPKEGGKGNKEKGCCNRKNKENTKKNGKCCNR